MFIFTKLLIVLGIIIMLSTYTSAFFLNWGSAEPQTPVQYYYHKRVLQNSPAYTVASETDPQSASAPLPSIPMQVPLQAQLTPASNVHNVQLVPCLCPVSDYYNENGQTSENIYVNPNQQKNGQNQ